MNKVESRIVIMHFFYPEISGCDVSGIMAHFSYIDL